MPKSFHRARAKREHALLPAVALTVLTACAGAPEVVKAPDPAQMSAPATGAGAQPGPGNPDDAIVPGRPGQIVSRNALLDPGRFSDLPGWSQDDLLVGWDSFLTSCQALTKKPVWTPVCQRAADVRRDNDSIHKFFEAEFSLYRIGNPDATRIGDVTGYYEPVIAGSLHREGSFTVPVYGTPNDLYTVDWKTIPAPLRHATINMVAHGRELAMVARAQPGSVRLDASRFTADARYRLWSVRLEGGQAVPYRTRAEIVAMDHLDAPVLAWVDDPLALYAMQTQGSGRVRLADGTLVRMQFASQNGQPFKPLRLVATAAPSKRVATRSLSLPEPEVGTQHFALAADDDVPTASAPVRPPITTRSLRIASQAPEVAVPTDAVKSPSGPGGRPASPPAAKPASAINMDPSYVFFQLGSAKAPAEGPVGALGVPLTAGRSIAVDPRTTPLGYPVYVSASTDGNGKTPPLRRLFMAQDTGGAIRGAVRADVFWGQGHEAEREALQTPQHGQMWLMLPRAEAASLSRPVVATRSLNARPAASADAECLIQDDQHCVDTN